MKPSMTPRDLGLELSPSRTSIPVQPLSSLADLLARWDEGEGPLFVRLADKLRHGMLTGRLVGGMRLPPERQLARHLGVARNTVVRAYAELEAESRVTRRQG